MFKNVVPNLVSFDTSLKKIRGFYFSDDFNFYPQSDTKNTFHYKIFIDNKIIIPKDYNFKDGYFLNFENKWYYERKIGIFVLKFCFDPKNRTFRYNKLYSLIPFEIGHIFPVGRHISDFINIELFFEDFILIRGCAFNYEGSNFCIIGPSMNGKTSLIKEILEKGGKYISEDILFMNFQKNKIYPTASTKNFNRFTNRALNALLKHKEVVLNPVDINKIVLIQNTTNQNLKIVNKNMFDYFSLNSFLFLKNHIVRSYIFESNLVDAMFDKINRLKSLKILFEFESLVNFKFKFLTKL